MSKLYLRSLKSGWLIGYAFSIILMFFYYSQTSVGVDLWLMNAHYVPVYLNTAFILLSISKTKYFENVITNCLVRLKEEGCVSELLIISVYSVALYELTSVVLVSLLYLGTADSMLRLLSYILVSACVFGIYELIYTEVILKRIPRIMMVSPLIINIVLEFVQHFVFARG